MNRSVKAVGEVAVSRRRPEPADHENNAHRDSTQQRGEPQSRYSSPQRSSQQRRGRKTLNRPWHEQQPADPIDMGGLKSGVGGLSNLGEQRIVNGVNRPYQPHHEPRRHEMHDCDTFDGAARKIHPQKVGARTRGRLTDLGG